MIDEFLQPEAAEEGRGGNDSDARSAPGRAKGKAKGKKVVEEQSEEQSERRGRRSWSSEEDSLLRLLVLEHGLKWSKIAEKIHGRDRTQAHMCSRRHICTLCQTRVGGSAMAQVVPRCKWQERLTS